MSTASIIAENAENVNGGARHLGAFVVTFFPDRAPTEKEERRFTLEQLSLHIVGEAAGAKEELPWLKLAKFNGEPNPKNPAAGCLRYDAGVTAVSGVEGDYDDGVMTMQEAADKLEKAKIKALLYTSASHRPDKPRWRVLCPFSTERTPAERTHFLDQLNGVLDGVLT